MTTWYLGFAGGGDNYFNQVFPVPMRDYPVLMDDLNILCANVGQDFNLDSLSLS